MHNAIIPFAAVLSILTAGTSGIDLYEVKTAEPLIVGTASRVSPVYAGEQITLPWTVLKRTDCRGVAGRVWTGEDRFYLSEPQFTTSLPKTKEYKTYRIQTHIPDLAPVGDLTLNIIGYYDCPEGRKDWELTPVSLRVVDVD